MRDIRICDRCGFAYIKNTNTIFNRLKPVAKIVKVLREIDLCDSCFGMLYNFLNKNEVNSSGE